MKHALTLLLLLPFTTKADQWRDPDWREMTYESDVIALVEYTSDGDSFAKAKPLRVYRGEFRSGEVWISGFSNRYGPIDKMRVGDRYIVFLKAAERSARTIEYWKGRIKEEPELIPYFEALKARNAYYVWTPTAGDLVIKGKSVRYDLLQTTTHGEQSFYPLNEFESFLRATTQPEKSGFHRRVLREVKNNALHTRCAQYLMMLTLTSFTDFDPVFQTIANGKDPASNYALAQLLGQMQGDKPRDLLLQMLDNESSLVQGEVVRQLADEDPDLIGPILVKRLRTAASDRMYHTNIMDPVVNSIDGGQIEIIQTLAKIKYKPATAGLLPLLDTDDEYLFPLVVEALLALDSKAFVPYLNKHLRNRTHSLIFSICSIIARNDLKVCKPALMEFISNHNRNGDHDYSYTVSWYMGLAHFDDAETRAFLLDDFENLLLNSDTINGDKLNRWIREYIDTFTRLESAEARPLIYNALFHWHGIDAAFAEHPELFAVKRSIENSLNQEVGKVLEGVQIENVVSLVHITNIPDVLKGAAPDFECRVQINLAGDIPGLQSLEDVTSVGNKLFQNLQAHREKVSQALGIPLDNIGARQGMFVSEVDERFTTNISSSPMGTFYKYAKQLPHEDDLRFLKALRENGFASNEFDQRQLQGAIDEIEGKL